jgi:hypothetical protein
MGRVTDRLEREERNDHPVAFGLLALVGVAVVVGIVAGVVALAGAKVAGLDSSGGASGGSEEQVSLYLPKPQATEGDNGPLITLAPGRQSPTKEPSQQPGEEKSSKKPEDKGISLQVAQPSVSPMDNIDLSGVYPGGEGAILQVQRFEGGAWKDFPVTASVSDETFATYVQTGQTGVNRFRVVDTDTGKASNEVKVTIRG